MSLNKQNIDFIKVKIDKDLARNVSLGVQLGFLCILELLAKEPDISIDELEEVLMELLNVTK